MGPNSWSYFFFVVLASVPISTVFMVSQDTVLKISMVLVKRFRKLLMYLESAEHLSVNLSPVDVSGTVF